MKILLFFLIACFSCVKNNEVADANNFMRFDLNGTRIVCNSQMRAEVGISQMSLEGSWANGSAIQLVIWETLPGEYVFSAGNCYGAVLYQNSISELSGVICGQGGVSNLFGPGKVTISSVNNYVTGTFEFTTEGPTPEVITNGQFSLKRQ